MRLILALATLALFPAAAGGAASVPILYQSSRECPAHRSCHGDPRYNTRILEIGRPGLSSRPLSSARFSDSNPAWSPDHKRVAFTRENPKLGAGYQLWVMNADGTDQRQLTRGQVDTEPSWAPDGKEIVFRGLSKDGKSFDLLMVNEDGAGLRRLTNDADAVAVTNPAWSPDGRWIAFERVNYEAGAGTGLYVMRPDATGLKRLALNASEPAWSPDSRRLAFSRAKPGQAFQIWTMSVAGAGQRQLTTGLESTSPAWSPDGRRIIFDRDDQIAIVSAAGGRIKQLTAPDGRAHENPAW
jgi:Tol biopolymer transport system component